MRLAILAGGDGWHVRDLRRAAGELGHTADLLNFRRLSASVGTQHLRDKPGGSLVGYDAVIVRTMPPGSLEQIVFRMDLLQRAQVSGVTVLNPPAALEACVDKYLATAKLAAAGLPVPPTVACQTAESALEAFAALGGDVVVKPLFGSEGRGMVRVSDPELAWRTFRTLERMQVVIYVQQFLPHPGWDLRLLVLGGRVFAAMRRHANDDWRTNVAQGGRAEAVTATLAEERLALGAAAAVGADFAGVDLLPTADGHVVLEVNAVPGWRALAPACGVDVAAAIAPVLDNAPLRRIGDTILDCVRATRRVTAVNTNLGIVLLLAPLASVQPHLDLRGGIMRALMRLEVADARAAFEAIRLANPGGLGTVPDQDVSGEPTVNLREAMGLAADRDLVARQYVNDFKEVFEGVEILREELRAPVVFPWPVLKTYLRLLATHPDSHIARKFGIETAREATRRTRLVFGASDPSGVDTQALRELQDWLSLPRSSPRNPGTTADLITATLFVALRQNIIQMPLPSLFPVG